MYSSTDDDPVESRNFLQRQLNCEFCLSKKVKLFGKLQFINEEELQLFDFIKFLLTVRH